ncbi:MAG: glutamine--fructose-6-phosphate transaminase (isomerizing) [Gaiellales bacterium]
MCGIIGYVGRRPARSLIVAGLERLEYRGYDSAGICLAEPESLDVVRAVGNLDQLRAAVSEQRVSAATSGIGHTRWATHGRVCVENAHPLRRAPKEDVAIALNGIVENYRELRASLLAEGHTFSSETDAETVLHLIARHYDGDLAAAVRSAYADLEGHFAFVVMHREHPGLLVALRKQCPLVVGIGDSEVFIASSIAAFLAETRRAKMIEEGEIVVADADDVTFLGLDGDVVEREAIEVDWDEDTAEKGGYETFMLKEIHEQPSAVADTIGERIRGGRLVLEDLGLDETEIRNLRRMVVLACGTAYHAGVVGRYLIEEWARLPCEPDIASEWRYRNPVLSRDTLVVAISQSGETADTLAALGLAREKGAHTVAITNMMGTQITREADSVLYTRAGIEMGVAATKTFTAQVTLLTLIALWLAEVRNTLPAEEIGRLVLEIQGLRRRIADFLKTDHPIDEIAARHAQKPFFLYLGRHLGLPVCLEGALKLKEISYVPTEAYSAGEMKHGPIALLDESTPVVCIATDSHVYDKMVSNIQEVRARGAQVIAIATDGNEDIQHHADDVIYVPRTHPYLQPVLATLPLQLLAYRIARIRGLNVDQPRNLAKTVTVE